MGEDRLASMENVNKRFVVVHFYRVMAKSPS